MRSVSETEVSSHTYHCIIVLVTAAPSLETKLILDHGLISHALAKVWTDVALIDRHTADARVHGCIVLTLILCCQCPGGSGHGR